ncbi:UDP-N-acetylmuramoyl-L-alanine--D-glutamate ligase [Candidatus Saccharibacteria bacterium]|nr:MAG: UDP-N-acetylmuramoyl-L-alanine--D-glutamate ligase [Candidatus Saccharibacteria bacterium]
MKVAIAGYGVEGRASLSYWRARGHDVTVADERDRLDDIPDGTPTILGAGAFGWLDEFDMVVRTASLRPDRIQTQGRVWSATNEFFEQCCAPIIGVTGTKGKGTTCSLIASILRAAGRTVHVVGNIGQPALAEIDDIQPDDIVVYELSSFQLWDLERSPHIAVVLPIERDHLDVHADMHEYVEAKANIARHQTADDVIVYHAGNDYTRRIAAYSPATTRIEYPFAIDQFEASLQLPGRHNVENAAAAIAATREYVSDDDAIKRGLAACEGLPHRLKFVAEVDGVRYYDDSISTTPGSAIAALNSFDQPKILILGGSDKGADYTAIVERCVATRTTIIAIGQTGETISAIGERRGALCHRVDGRMDQVVAEAKQLAQSGDVVILSPASASFDQYKNYADRGEQFIAAVKALAG